ncbi:signal peptidase II [Curtanaerobium respiraculi]|uniref:signal peptidase II n=1 Tax=Curtanaerobium respiraculi TaxID=2949669 RepID=UPI0024B38E5C|nr:signal peptidase II [Curtanaerobium respiraculi]
MPGRTDRKPIPRKAIALFGAVALLWFLADRATKAAVDVVRPGTLLVPDVLGLFEFRLVHNTGAAWGMFGGSTVALGVFSLVMCAAIVWFLFALERGGTALEGIGLALAFSGGMGNAVDRFAQGYVTDFINCTFIDFPVFNVADIGVTCGIALFFIAWIAADRGSRPEGGAPGGES